MPRTTMAALIARVRTLLANDTVFSDTDIQTFLDDHAVAVNGVLEPQVPFFTTHLAPFENLEAGAKIFYGFNTLLIETTDYTSDYQRGIFTTPNADYRGLRILGSAFDLHAAVADGWEAIAGRSAAQFDWSDVEGSYKPTQARDYALSMAKTHRRKAWAIGRTVERADTPALQDSGSDGRGDLIRRERAGYGPA